MARCPHCNIYYREPEDEQGEHPCPRCGRGPWDDEEESDQDIVEDDD